MSRHQEKTTLHGRYEAMHWLMGRDERLSTFWNTGLTLGVVLTLFGFLYPLPRVVGAALLVICVVPIWFLLRTRKRCRRELADVFKKAIDL